MNEESCQNCTSPEQATAQAGTFLICKKSPDSSKKWQIVDPKASCKNFTPTPDFRRNIRHIPLTQNKFATVDTADYPDLNKHKWTAARSPNTFYAVRSQGGKQIRMHRQITNAPNHLVVDHIDHNGLNNTRENLRLCTKAQNAKNQRKQKGTSSIYKGVCYNKKEKKWRARVHKNGKTYNLGDYKNEIKAAKAYDQKASALFGQYAHLNFQEK